MVGFGTGCPHPDGERTGPGRGGLAPILGAVLMLLGLAACGISGNRGEWSQEHMSDWRPPLGQSCAARPEPAILPPAAEVVNPERLGSAIREELPDAEGYVLFSIQQDSTGTPGMWERIAPIESDLAPGEQRRLTEILRPRLAPATFPGLRLRIELADQVTVSVGRQQVCTPAVANRDMYSRELQRLYQVHRLEMEAVLRVYVLEDGTPGASDLMQGSGNARLDADILETATRLHFHPGLSDRIPVPVWIQIPVILRRSR